MEIIGNKYNYNNLSFGSRKIMPVFVRDMNNRPVKAWFSKLNFLNPEDIDAMGKIAKEWKGKPGIKYDDLKSYYIDKIHSSFKEGYPVYAIEKDDKGNLFDKILCLHSTSRYLRDKIYTKNPFKKLLNLIPGIKMYGIWLEYLQASPNSNYFAGINRIYKGVGEAAMYGLAKFALNDTKKKIKNIELCSLYETIEFYSGLKMKYCGEECFSFNRKGMKRFIKKQNAKYKVLTKQAN